MHLSDMLIASSWLVRVAPVLIVDTAFALVGGYRWLRTGKHLGPAHRWCMFILGVTTIALLIGCAH